MSRDSKARNNHQRLPAHAPKPHRLNGWRNVAAVRTAAGTGHARVSSVRMFARKRRNQRFKSAIVTSAANFPSRMAMRARLSSVHNKTER